MDLILKPAILAEIFMTLSKQLFAVTVSTLKKI
jgi:hypothetical protein